MYSIFKMSSPEVDSIQTMMNISILRNNSLTSHLDYIRSRILRMVLKSELLRNIYRNRSSRLALNYLFFSVVYLVLSLQWSTLLLVLGPLVLGYPHLVASYRFAQKSILNSRWRYDSLFIFRFLSVLTVISLAIRFILPLFFKLPPQPYGFYEIILSVTVMGLVKLNSRLGFLSFSLSLFMIGGIVKLALYDPLAFVGVALLFHNWVALGHWFVAASDKINKLVVVFAIFIFAAIHILVLIGVFDSRISFSELSFLSARSFEIRGWAIAPWSNDPLVWNRVIVLYAFGLSMHYFIWLQAIPQCLDKSSVPNSFRISFEKLRKDCGRRTSVVLLVLGLIVFLAMWFHTALFGRIYFGIAMLHGWLELVFLIIALCFYVTEKLKIFKTTSNMKSAN